MVGILDAGAGDTWFAQQLVARLPEGTHVTCWDVNYGDDDVAAGTHVYMRGDITAVPWNALGGSTEYPLADRPLLVGNPCQHPRSLAADRGPVEAVALVEAPRGTLFHHYKIDENDQVEMANLIVSTTSNNEPMNQSVAKVARDRLMVAMDGEYPGYGLAKHKGYPSRMHLDALQALGVTPIHRRSYAPVRRMLEGPGGGAG